MQEDRLCLLKFSPMHPKHDITNTIAPTPINRYMNLHIYTDKLKHSNYFLYVFYNVKDSVQIQIHSRNGEEVGYHAVGKLSKTLLLESETAISIGRPSCINPSFNGTASMSSVAFLYIINRYTP